MLERKKRVKKKTSGSEFDGLLRQAREKYPYDPQRQVEFFRSEQTSTKYELVGLLKVTEMNLAEKYKTFEVSSENMDCIFRSLVDLTSHLKEDLPDGVYEYTLNNLKGITDSILKQYADINAVTWSPKTLFPASALPEANLLL
ncbi:hypothetical protein [Sporolactobacillus putidus]|uniref:Uncharacterized protein n=1 Tax=Sporolactobacillus putidus TaxID=492735 RepID=A0A917W1L5_9BACL|nr:hypothetical protein [Sporolactobacillus putidus]GGL51737.1 hypothetical protein GCM10007968_14850 [Sporolactobacillus putidus]